MFVDSCWSFFTSCEANAEVASNNKGNEVVARFTPVTTALGNQVVWWPPPSENIKINVDVSFVESISAASVGVVARNSSGDVVISSWDFIGLCSDEKEAELRACLAGLYRYFPSHA